MVDFNALLRSSSGEAPIEPRELHRSLPNKAAGYGYLRDVQAQVLNTWHGRRSERDLVLKVNTGSGKTINGLLVLQSLINEGHGPGLYVAPDRYLAAQVRAEADRLGIATVADVDSTPYLTSQAIGVINAYELVNGRSKFSDRRRTRAMAPIGSVVVDDAHAAIATTRSQLSLHLARSNAAYEKLLALFEADLRQQSVDGYLDLVAERPGTPLRVPFWAWRQKLEEVRTVLRGEAVDGGDLFFDWPAVADVLHLSRMVFSTTEVSVTPPLPPIGHVTAFAEAERRIFMTATLSDESVLVSDFDADPDSVSTPITPNEAGDIGERMILAPQEINPDIELSDVRAAIAALSMSYNVVVLAPSAKWAETWAAWATAIVTADQIESVVERLRTSHVGLVVMVNKYDGVDLPQDACRILVIDGLPEAFTGEDRLRSALLANQSGVDDRQVQRIEQGMGRGVRSNEDHCVVLLLGPRLAQLTVDPRTVEHFSPATQAQLKLSRVVAGQVEGEPLAAVLGVIDQALKRDPGWVVFAKEGLRNVRPEGGTVSMSARAERAAFAHAIAGDLEGAATALQGAAESEESEKVAGALLEQAAAYIDVRDPERAQRVLATARSRNNWVERPLEGVAYRPITVPSTQASAAVEALGHRYGGATALLLGFDVIVDGLHFDPNRTEDFEEAMLQLGFVLGLGSQRPEHELGRGPDNLWAIPDGRYWVIEAKTGATSKGIGKRDLGQLSQSMLWFGSSYGPTVTPTPVMVHRAVAVYKDATTLPGLQVLTEEALLRLRSNVKAYANGLATEGWTNEAVVDRLLRGHALDAESLTSYLTRQRGVVQQ